MPFLGELIRPVPPHPSRREAKRFHQDLRNRPAHQRWDSIPDLAIAVPHIANEAEGIQKRLEPRRLSN